MTAKPSDPSPSRRSVLSGAAAIGAGLAVFGDVHCAAPASASGGAQWPRGYELPTLPEPEHLDAVLAAGAPVDLRLLLTTLQGLVNRTRPEIYIIGDPTEGKYTWLRDTRLPYRTYDDPWKLIHKYLPRAKGIVIYDPEVPETVNVATTIAGLRDGVVASPELAARLTAPPYSKAVIDDLRGRFENTVEAATWAFEHLWPQCTHKLLIGLSSSTSKPIPDDNWKDFVELVRETEQIRDGSNRKVHELDLARFTGGEFVYLRFTDAFPADGWGPAVNHVTVKADGLVVADFIAGSDAEREALWDRGSSTFKPESGPDKAHRFADGNGYFVYEIAVPPGAGQLTASIDMFNQYVVSASKVRPQVSSADRIPESLPFRDYAVAVKAMPFWLAPNDAPEETAVLERIFSSVEDGTPYLGWFPDEFAGVRLASRNGVYTLAADFLENASVWAGIRPKIRLQRTVPAPELAKKIYVTFTFSEGDNLQYDQHHLRVLWDNPARGDVPINWSISPLIIDAMPMMWEHFRRTATAADLLTVGPSGAGYFYPSLWPAAHLQTFLAQQKERYFDLPGMDVMYALDDGPALTDATAQAYAEKLQLRGIVYNMWHVRSDTTMRAGGKLPVSTQLGIGNKDEMVSRIVANARDFDGSKPVFIAVGVPAWDLNPADIVDIVARARQQVDGDLVPVRGDHYFDLVRKANGLG